MRSDDELMQEALRVAETANDHDEVPVGCIFVYEDEIIAVGANEVNETKNATRHAELVCIDKVMLFASERGLDWMDVFSKTTVVVTVEPCIMCAAALIEVGIPKVVFGCKNERFGGTTVVDVWSVLGSKCQLVGNVRGDEAIALLKEFYSHVNPTAPNPKTKNKLPKQIKN